MRCRCKRISWIANYITEWNRNLDLMGRVSEFETWIRFLTDGEGMRSCFGLCWAPKCADILEIYGQFYKTTTETCAVMVSQSTGISTWYCYIARALAQTKRNTFAVRSWAAIPLLLDQRRTALKSLNGAHNWGLTFI